MLCLENVPAVSYHTTPSTWFTLLTPHLLCKGVRPLFLCNTIIVNILVGYHGFQDLLRAIGFTLSCPHAQKISFLFFEYLQAAVFLGNPKHGRQAWSCIVHLSARKKNLINFGRVSYAMLKLCFALLYGV